MKEFLRTVAYNTIIFFLFFGLSACMWMPAPRDDFSNLGDDPFSNMIRNCGCDSGAQMKCRTLVPYRGIDQDKIETVAARMFAKVPKPYVLALFNKYGGKCSTLDTIANGDVVQCEISRQWQLKNIGAPFNTGHWPDPGVRFVYDFEFSSTHEVIGIKLTPHDITVYKPHVEQRTTYHR